MKKNAKLLLFLRKIGLLCKKKQPYKPKLKLSKSVNSLGKEINHKDIMFAKNALQGVAKNNKDRRLCYYDYTLHSCRCGLTLDKLKQNENCPLK